MPQNEEMTHVCPEPSIADNFSISDSILSYVLCNYEIYISRYLKLDFQHFCQVFLMQVFCLHNEVNWPLMYSSKNVKAIIYCTKTFNQHQFEVLHLLLLVRVVEVVKFCLNLRANCSS